MNKKLSTILTSIGFIFLLNAIFGRYLVLPGYLASLEQGRSTLGTVSQAVSAWKIIRYLLWAYSFKFGIYLIVMGVIVRTTMSPARKWIVATSGLIYISFAYMPLPEPSSIIFGLAGGLMTAMMVFLVFRWSRERENLPEMLKKASDYRLVGYFFFAMATYTICPLLGVKTFALSPEKMIQYGLQPEAASFAFHLLIELVLGWSFFALSYRAAQSESYIYAKHSEHSTGLI